MRRVRGWITRGAAESEHAGAPDADDAPARAPVQRKSRVVMADEWFETVAIAQQRAKRRLPKSVYSS